jgi:hypothetical protein
MFCYTKDELPAVWCLVKLNGCPISSGILLSGQKLIFSGSNRGFSLLVRRKTVVFDTTLICVQNSSSLFQD